MGALLDDMVARARQGVDEQEAVGLDLHFHDAFYRASGHQRLLGYWTTLRPHIYVFLLSRSVARPDFNELMAQGHRMILDAICDRDETRAQALIESHIDFTYTKVIGSYSQDGQKEG